MDIYPIKNVHMAKMMNEKGDVSPLCAKNPRKINLKNATWTIIRHRVTCKACIAKLKETGESK